MQELSKKPLVDVLSEQTERQVVMSGESYVYLDTKEIIGADVVDLALIKQELELKEMQDAKAVEDAKQYLLDTDHKFVSDYELKVGETLEDIEVIRVKRSEARDLIRSL